MNALPSNTAFELNPLDLKPRGDIAAIRKRLFSPRREPVKRVESAEAPAIVHMKETRPAAPRRRRIIVAKPSWKRMDNHFDAHVVDTRFERGEIHLSPIAFLRRRCIFHAAKFDDMVGHSRKRMFVPTRDILILEVKLAYPYLSLPQIGRLFGGRDHTTILHSLRKLGVDHGAIRGTTASRGDEIKSLWLDGQTQQEIARALKLTQSAVSRFIKKQDWRR
jgi:hypothetical protein